MIHLALAGAGEWGRNHLRALTTLRGAGLAWVVDPDPARRAEAAVLAPRAKLAADLGPVLADPRVKAVVIAAPGPTHLGLARQALAAGRHVLVEKPLAPTAPEAWALVKAARRARRLLGVGHLLLHHPAVERLKRWVDEGRLGRVRYIHCQRTNIGRVRTDEGALTSLAPHDVSLMVHLLGRWPVAVAARGARWAQPQWEDLVFVVLRFPGGQLGHIHLSWLDPQKVRRVSVVGEGRMAVFDDMDPARRLALYERSPAEPEPGGGWRPGHEGPVRAPRLSAREPLREELRAFLAAVRGTGALRATGEDGARVMEVLDAAQRSIAAGGREVTLARAGNSRRPRGAGAENRGP